MITEAQSIAAMINFLTDAIRIGLTIDEARTVAQISLALNVPLPELIDQLEQKPERLEKIRALSGNK